MNLTKVLAFGWSPQYGVVACEIADFLEANDDLNLACCSWRVHQLLTTPDIWEKYLRVGPFQCHPNVGALSEKFSAKSHPSNYKMIVQTLARPNNALAISRMLATIDRGDLKAPHKAKKAGVVRRVVTRGAVTSADPWEALMRSANQFPEKSISSKRPAPAPSEMNSTSSTKRTKRGTGAPQRAAR
eukprot:Selendium_serpulae@DN2031_c0_g1_i1.p1